MNLHQLETFVHVAEHGSFSKAALVLGVGQPALSRQVRALETELHETLLLRNGRGVELTQAGRRLLEHCQSILDVVAQAKEDLLAQRNEPVGHITVAMPPTLARLHTLKLIQSFRATLPKARLAIMEGFSIHLTEWLLTGRADVGLVYNPDPLPALEILPLKQEPLCLLSPARRAPRRALTLQEVSRHALIMPQRGHIFRTLMEKSAALAGVQLQVECEVSSVPAILDLVSAGVGHAALGETTLQSFEHPERLALTRFKDTSIRSTLCLVTPAQRRATPLTQRTVALLTQLVQGA